VFQTFNWCWHWCNYFLASDGVEKTSLAIVTGRSNGRLVMVWPLVLEIKGGLKQISWLGDPVSQYGDVIVEDGVVKSGDLAAAWAYLKTELTPDLARLRKVRGDANVQAIFTTSSAIATERLEAPYLNLASAKSFDDYEQRHSPRARRNRKRLTRRFSERGGMEFIRVREGAQSRNLVRKAIELKQAWLTDRALVSPALSDPRTMKFFQAAAEGNTRPVGCVVSALKSNGEVTALEVAFACKGHLAMHIIVYNLAYEKAGAGVIQLEKSIRDAFNEGIHTYDLLAPSADYKLDWADDVMEVADWALPISLKGQAFARLYLGWLRPRAKSALIKMPAYLRRLVASSYVALLVV
jgi:CelD/BcsL family acetyltransferase involved in cellulose biosynthesis